MTELLLTEKSNIKTRDIDLKESLEIVKLVNDEDKTVAIAVEKELEKISQAVEIIANSLNNGGHLLYFGAGTSGRLGVLDASECPPTFGVRSDLVRGYIAGGDQALRKAIEGAEDIFENGETDLISSGAQAGDVVVGISASGRAPYVCGVLSKARELSMKTIALSCNSKAKMAEYAEIHIHPEVGPEVITGSSRLKAGTAHKMILNMLTTASMIKIGKTYHNYMVDVMPTNIKLVDRAIRIISELSGKSYAKAEEYFYQSDKNVKISTIMAVKNISKEEAKELLKQHSGKLRLIIG